MAHPIKRHGKVLDIYPGAIICDSAILVGDVVICENCVVHPKAEINGEEALIVLGPNCIVEEYAKVIARPPVDHPSGQPYTCFIGPDNTFEVGSTVTTSGLGGNNTFEPKCVVPIDVKIESNCVIGAACELRGPRTLPDSTIWHRKSLAGKYFDPKPCKTFQTDYLKKLLPNYHRVFRANQEPKKRKTEFEMENRAYETEY